MDTHDSLALPPEEEEYDWWEEHCGIIPPEPFRVILVLYVGTAVASVSVLFNAFLFCILAANRRHRASHFLYLTSLAFADVFLSGAYILLFTVNIAIDHFESEFLARAWYSYMRPVLTLSHVAITSSAFFIVAAAFERLITICRLGPRLAHGHRKMVCVGVVAFAVLTKAPMYFEVQMSELSQSEPYATVYKFWFRNLVTIFAPFFLIVFLNARIVHRLREQHHGAQLFRFATSEHRQNIRSATLMLVFVCCTYLASNLLNVVVNAWEFIDKDSLFTPTIRPIYTYSSDFVSFFTVLASAFRLPIYTFCNARIRTEVLASLLCVSVSLYPRCLPGARKMSSKVRILLPFRMVQKLSRPPPTSTVRYCETGDGFMIYETSSRHGRQSRCIGTGLDKVVLSVAIGRINRELENGNLLTPDYGRRFERGDIPPDSHSV